MNNCEFIKLSSVLSESRKIAIRPDPARRITVRLNIKGVEKREETSDKPGATKYYVRSMGQFIYGKQNLFKGAFGIVPQDLDGFESSSDLPAFDIDKTLLPEWLIYFLKRDNFYQRLESLARGAGSKRIAPEDFLQLMIPCPVKAVQKQVLTRIAKVDEMIEKLQDENETQLTLIQQLRKQILQDAIEGKLTADWRKKNPALITGENHALKLLEKISKYWKDNKLKCRAQKNGQFNEFIPDLPGWVRTNIDSIGIVKIGGTPDRQLLTFWSGTIPWVSSGEVANCEIFETNEYITDLGSKESAAKLLPKGSLLVAMIGQGKTRGQTAILRIHAATNQNVCGIIINHGQIDVRYLWYYFLSRYDESRSYATGGNQLALNGAKIGDFFLDLPPLAEQKVIATHVDKLMLIIDELEKQISTRKDQSKMLMQSVLREAFEK